MQASFVDGLSADRQTEALASGLKAYSSWMAIDAIQVGTVGSGGKERGGSGEKDVLEVVRVTNVQ